MVRLDLYLAKQENISRQKVQDYIQDGCVFVNNKVIKKSSFQVKEEDAVELLIPDIHYVARSGFKLHEALSAFNIDLSNRIIIDIGSSTGGFSECCLNHGAKKVYAVDVGTDQLHHSLRTIPNLVSMENTNARNLKITDFNEKIDFVCMDVSFISCKFLIPIISMLLDDTGECVILIKPQFEVGKKYIGKNGIVKDKKAKRVILQEIVDEAIIHKLNPIGLIECATVGRDGNQEYLLHLSKTSLKRIFDYKKIVT